MTPPSTRLRRLHDKGAHDRATIDAILDAMPVAHVGHLVEPACHVRGLRLDLLHPHTIRPAGLSPFDEAFAGCGSNPVQIERDEPKSHR